MLQISSVISIDFYPLTKDFHMLCHLNRHLPAQWEEMEALEPKLLAKDRQSHRDFPILLVALHSWWHSQPNTLTFSPAWVHFLSVLRDNQSSYLKSGWQNLKFATAASDSSCMQGLENSAAPFHEGQTISAISTDLLGAWLCPVNLREKAQSEILVRSTWPKWSDTARRAYNII